MGENLKFQQIAEEASRMLHEHKDQMVSFGISEHLLVFGTFNGCVHILFFQTSEGIMLGPFPGSIKDISCLGYSVAFIYQNQVVLFNAQTSQNTFATSIQNVTKLSICSSLLGSIALVCDSPANLVVVQKGWVSTNTKQLRVYTRSVYELVAHGHLACVADVNCAKVVNLTNEVVVYEKLVPWGEGKFHWMTPKTLLVCTGKTVEMLIYSNTPNDFLTLTESISMPYAPLSIGSFNSSNIIVLNEENISIYSSNDVIIKGKPPIHGGILLCNNRASAPFYLVGSNQIFKIDLPSVKEKIKKLLVKFKFDKAYDICERFRQDCSDVVVGHIEYLVKLKKFEEAAELFRMKFNKTDKRVNEIIQMFMKNKVVHLIIKEIPFIEDERLNISILESLSQHKAHLEFYMQKWPLNVLTQSSTINALKFLGFNDILIDIFLKQGKTTEALKISLEVKSPKSFEILNVHPETFTLFSEIPNFWRNIFELDCSQATKVCTQHKMEIQKVIEWLPSALVIKLLLSYDRVDLSLEKILFQELIKHSPTQLTAFIANVKFLDYEYLYEALKPTSLDSLKVFVLRKLNNEEEVQKILLTNFEVRLEFIKHYPYLWPDTLIEAKESIYKTKKALRYLHLHEDPIAFITSLEFKDFEDEIKHFIKLQGELINIHEHSVSAAKIEAFQEFQKLYVEYSKGILINQPFLCSRCAQPLTTFRLRKCGHHSHKDCFDKCIFCVDTSF